MIKIAIVGFGTVGQGVAELLIRKREWIERSIGKFRVTAVADSKSSMSGDFSLLEALKMKRETGRLRDDIRAAEIVKSGDYDVLIEASVTRVGGGDGVTYIKEALKRGKHVITSNKGPLVAEFDSLMSLAEKMV